MRVAINHETIYRYQSPANYSVQYLRLTPLSGPTQRVLSWKLHVPGNLRPWTDAFGNAAHVLVVDEPHQELRITAVGEVEITDGGKPLLSESEPHGPELYLRSTRLTEADDRVTRFAAGFKPAFVTSPRRGLDGLMKGIRESIEALPGDAHTACSARQVLDRKAGLGQDQTHLFVTCCRSLGLPARYVSGYLCTDSATDERMTNHAWAEVWIEGAGWLRYDIGNRDATARAHVRLAIGLDFLDAAPIRGMRRGGTANEELEIEVSVSDARLVRKVQAQAQQ